MTDPIPPSGVAFLLAQVGAHAAQRFAERVAELGLNPAHVGVLRLVAERSGLSQQALAAALGVAPSKVVGLLDDLENRGLVTRRRSATDRRSSELHLTEAAGQDLARLRTVVRDHDAELTAALDEEELQTLGMLLRRVAAQQGLRPGVHPGYRTMSRGGSPGARRGATG